MSLRNVTADVVMSGAKGAGTFNSPVISGAGYSADVVILAHVTAASGTSPTLALSLEQSNDGTTWTAVPNSAAAVVIAVGNTMANATTTMQLCRVVAVIGGTTPSFTFRVAVQVWSD